VPTKARSWEPAYSRVPIQKKIDRQGGQDPESRPTLHSFIDCAALKAISTQHKQFHPGQLQASWPASRRANSSPLNTCSWADVNNMHMHYAIVEEESVGCTNLTRLSAQQPWHVKIHWVQTRVLRPDFVVRDGSVVSSVPYVRSVAGSKPTLATM